MTTPKDNALHMMEGQGGEQLSDIVDDLRGLHAQTTPGVWGKGQTTHHTVTRRDGHPPYRIAEFHHAHDAAFCDAAHAFVPLLLSTLELLAAPKTALQHFADEVEASGDAEKHAVCATCNGSTYVITGRGEFAGGEECPACVGGTPHFAIQPSTDVATLQRELALAYAGLERERGIAKELAAVLKDVAWRIDDIRDMLMKQNGRGDRIYGCDEWSTPTMNLATAHKVITAALAKVPKP